MTKAIFSAMSVPSAWIGLVLRSFLWSVGWILCCWEHHPPLGTHQPPPSFMALLMHNTFCRSLGQHFMTRLESTTLCKCKGHLQARTSVWKWLALKKMGLGCCFLLALKAISSKEPARCSTGFKSSQLKDSRRSFREIFLPHIAWLNLSLCLPYKMNDVD